jgi:hypothetical protein
MVAPTFEFPAIGPGSASLSTRYPSDKFAINSPYRAKPIDYNSNKNHRDNDTDKTTRTTDYEDDEKGVYEVVQEGLESERPSLEASESGSESPESIAAKRKAALAKLKRVPRIVGSVDHAIMPMAPVCLFLFSWYLGGLDDVILFCVAASILSRYT